MEATKIDCLRTQAALEAVAALHLAATEQSVPGILSGALAWAKDLLEKLFQKNPEKRLGSGPEQAEEIKLKHLIIILVYVFI